MKAFCLIALCFFPLFIQAQPAWQWAAIANDPGESMCNSIATDAAGNAYVVGTFTGTLHLGATTLTSTGDSDIFFAKYDPLGNLVWAKHEGGPGGDQGFGIAIDAQGAVYVAGTFYQSIAFDTFSFASNGFADLCLAKYDSNGHLIWAKAWGSIYSDVGSKIAIDGNENIYLTGSFSGDGGSPPVHGTIIFDTVTLTSTGTGDMFLVNSIRRAM
ncbi:MAG: SBBP repeat-containing protein [Bacteroidetes bacterium]|nr:SBBP repeat-containing protein [Bacteroidota bacterium]